MVSKKIKTLQDLNERFKDHSKKLFKLFPPKTRKKDIETIVRLAKIQEEVGELAEAVLDSLGMERNKEKITNIEEEIGDVIITVAMLAYWLGIDPWKATINKFLATDKRLRKFEEQKILSHYPRNNRRS